VTDAIIYHWRGGANQPLPAAKPGIQAPGVGLKQDLTGGVGI